VERFTRVESIAAPLMLQNVDTDVIIPMRRIVSLRRGDDLSRYAFEPLRYGPEGADGSENPDFVLNRPEYQGAEILLAGENFGCGSSREPAVWVIRGMGFRVIIAPSFGDIFFGNCFQRGMLPIVLPLATVEAFAELAREPAARFIVDLERCEVTTPAGDRVPFEVNPLRREGLLEGLDDIGLTSRREAEIAAFQSADRVRRPWVYAPGDGVQE